MLIELRTKRAKGSAGWHVPAGFYTRTGDENKEGMIRGSGQV